MMKARALLLGIAMAAALGAAANAAILALPIGSPWVILARGVTGEVTYVDAGYNILGMSGVDGG